MKRHQIISFLCLITLSFAYLYSAKLLIITHNYNQPSFIEMQYQTFKKFLIDDFQYVVFNDAIDPQIADQITSTCNALGITCYRVQQEHRTLPNVKIDLKNGIFWAAARHGQAIQYSMDLLAFNHPGLVMMIDSDMFLIKSFDAHNFMKDNEIAGLRQVRNGTISYLWGGLIFFRMDKLANKESMNFSNGLIDRTYVDSCGFLHYYFQANPHVKILYFDQNFRHFLDANMRSYIIPTNYNGNNFKSWLKYLRCKQCQKNKRTCPHSDAILKEFNFDESIIEYVVSKKMPPKIEFVLKDTFLHYQDGTNYENAPLKFVEHKKELLFSFMNNILLRESKDSIKAIANGQQ